MQYRACDFCGCLVGTLFPPAPGESLICNGCLERRRVPVEPEAPSQARHPKHTRKFRCLYCQRKLRSKPVAREVRLGCPACAGVLLLAPDGAVRKATGAEALMSSSSESTTPLVRPHESLDPDDDGSLAFARGVGGSSGLRRR